MQRIAQLRKKDHITQFKLAEKLGISQQTVSKYERGLIEPDINTLITLAYIFNVSVDYLLGITNLPNNDMAQNIPEPLYLRLANEAQSMQLAEEDVDYIIGLYKRVRKIRTL